MNDSPSPPMKIRRTTPATVLSDNPAPSELPEHHSNHRPACPEKLRRPMQEQSCAPPPRATQSPREAATPTPWQLPFEHPDHRPRVPQKLRCPTRDVVQDIDAVRSTFFDDSLTILPVQHMSVA